MALLAQGSCQWAYCISQFSSLSSISHVSFPDFPVTLGFKNVSCFFLFFLEITDLDQRGKCYSGFHKSYWERWLSWWMIMNDLVGTQIQNHKGRMIGITGQEQAQTQAGGDWHSALVCSILYFFLCGFKTKFAVFPSVLWPSKGRSWDKGSTSIYLMNKPMNKSFNFQLIIYNYIYKYPLISHLSSGINSRRNLWIWYLHIQECALTKFYSWLHTAISYVIIIF